MRTNHDICILIDARLTQFKGALSHGTMTKATRLLDQLDVLTAELRWNMHGHGNPYDQPADFPLPLHVQGKTINVKPDISP